MKKLKVAILLISNGWSGAESVVYDLTKNLAENNVDISLLANREMVKYYKSIEGLTIHDLGPIYKKSRVLRLFYFYKINKKIQSIIKKFNLDLVNLHLEGAFIAYYGLYRKIKIPVITTLHGGEIKKFYQRNENLYDLLDKICLKQALENSIAINSVGNFQIEKIENKYKSKVTVIPNGVNTKKFRPLKIKKRQETILYVGRLIEMKGVRELINVAKQLPQYEFWFAGQGPLAKLINLPNTKNLGFKSNKELVRLYNKSTICVFPSHHESFGLVGLEAMACGKPVIATPLGFSEYIQNGKDGIIISAKDEKALKEAIINLMTNEKLRKKLEKNARKKTLKHTWGNVVKQYLKVFKGVISQHKAKKSSIS